MLNQKMSEDGEQVAGSSLRLQIDSELKSKLKGEIQKVKDPFYESERVLLASSAAEIMEIARHVQDCQEVFVTGDKLGIAPRLPKGVEAQFQVPFELTPPRERPYVMDREGRLRELGIEVRQETKDGFTVQTTKIGKTSETEDSTMDRWEQKSKLTGGFGFNIYAIGDKAARERALQELTSYPKLAERLISQRIRIPYFPEGNRDLEIELALEPVHCGETFTGFTWQYHKIDIEIKKGPDKSQQALRHAILAREEERLMSTFPLTRQRVSSATPGFDAIMEDLRTARHSNAFDKMGVNEQWWKDENRLRELKLVS